MSLLNTTESYLSQQTSSHSGDSHSVNGSQSQARHTIAQHRYVEYIRRLPPQSTVNALVQTYFALTNWEYDLLDRHVFQTQLAAWSSVSYVDLQEKNFGGIEFELLGFPSLLFQVLAQALLVHPPHDEAVKGLLTLAGMTLHDIGMEYSNAGAGLSRLLGSAAITTMTIQAGILRVAFLKSSGDIVEAWHTLGSTIRDAQELGLHISSDKGEQGLDDPAKLEGTQLTSIVRKKVWLVLHIWDAHMAVVLGRPMATNLHLESFTHSYGDCAEQRDLLEHWRNEAEPPRPFDIIMAGYSVAYRFLQDIHELDHRQTNFARDTTVERIHATIVQNLEMLPSWCRPENPSLRFDTVEGLQWLPAARETMYTLVHVVLLALHRPRIFHEPGSRVEALKAGLAILQAQERLFQDSEPHWRILFTPVYATFDAVVLILAIFIAFPNENLITRTDCLQAVEQAIHQLDIIGRSNDMARSAHAIASSLYHRLKHHRSNKDSMQEDSRDAGASITRSKCSSNPILPDGSFDAVLPPQPIHDLFYNDLSTTQDPHSQTSSDGLLGDELWPANMSDMWNFEGDFANTSFWSILNDCDAN